MTNAKPETSKSKSGGPGRLIGIGVGPGDPGLVTQVAAELIRDASVLAFPVHKEGAGSRALDTVAGHVSEATRLLPLLMPMTRDRDELERAHKEATAALEEAAAGGTDVVYLSIGDPMFYSTFGYLAERFSGPVEAVSGISAMNAAAAAVGEPLASGDTPTMIVTGGDDEGIRTGIELGASMMIIKPRSLSAVSLDLMEQTGAFKRARAAVELGGEQEEILQEIDREAAMRLPYFSILWINPGGNGDPDPGSGRHRVHFIGAGPGDPELLTLKGRRLLSEADSVIYAGSLVDTAVLEHCRRAEMIDSAALDLDGIIKAIVCRYREGKKVVRLHSGDPSLYGAIKEQITRLRREDVPFAVIPGVTSLSAAAAALESELTVPEVSQTVIVTRAAGRTPVPDKESIERLAVHNATMAVFLSAGLADKLQRQLLEEYPPSTPVAVVQYASRPGQVVLRTTTASMAADMEAAGIERTAIIFIGDTLAQAGEESRLYDSGFSHGFRDGGIGDEH